MKLDEARTEINECKSENIWQTDDGGLATHFTNALSVTVNNSMRQSPSSEDNNH